MKTDKMRQTAFLCDLFVGCVHNTRYERDNDFDDKVIDNDSHLYLYLSSTTAFT